MNITIYMIIINKVNILIIICIEKNEESIMRCLSCSNIFDEPLQFTIKRVHKLYKKSKDMQVTYYINVIRLLFNVSNASRLLILK